MRRVTFHKGTLMATLAGGVAGPTVDLRTLMATLAGGVAGPTVDLRTLLIRKVTCPTCHLFAWAKHHQPVELFREYHHPTCHHVTGLPLARGPMRLVLR